MDKKQIEKLPIVVQQKIQELEELLNQYPKKMPTTKVASFLGMDVECLRRAIEQGKTPFSIGCDNDSYGNRYTYISSVTFYLWYCSPILK